MSFFVVNEHNIERIARVIIGLVLIGLALFTGALWGWIGIVPLATGLSGFCPLYRLLGFSTCKLKKPV